MGTLYENSSWNPALPMRPGGIKLTERLFNISRIKSGIILDFGCGSGYTARYLTDNMFEVVGIDKSEILLEKAALRCPETRFILSENFENLDFQNSFDGIISECVIASLDNIQETITKLHSFLKYNGIFIINDIMSLIKKDKGSFYTFSDWIKILKISGFEIIYHEDNTSELKQFFLETIWNNPSNCIKDCIPKGYKAKETGYFSIIAKKI